MEFKTLFPILKKYLADDADVPYFFRELMAMVTTVTEEEWGSSKDPSTKTKDETLRTYAKRGISQKLAKTIVYRLTPEILVERINEKSETVRNLLASDLHGYDASLNAENVAEQIAAWMVEIVQTRAGLIQQSKLEKQKQKQAEAGLYGCIPSHPPLFSFPISHRMGWHCCLRSDRRQYGINTVTTF